MSKKILIKEDALKGAIDAMSAVGINMRLNAPHLSGKSWGDLDIAKAALIEALEQLVNFHATQLSDGRSTPRCQPLNTTPPAAPEQPDQEPVPENFMHALKFDVAVRDAREWDALYTAPPAAQRTWVDLTDEEIQNCYGGSVDDFARALLAKSKERNT